eukprot:527130-Amphidinium_carterae.1
MQPKRSQTAQKTAILQAKVFLNKEKQLKMQLMAMNNELKFAHRTASVPDSTRCVWKETRNYACNRGALNILVNNS